MNGECICFPVLFKEKNSLSNPCTYLSLSLFTFCYCNKTRVRTAHWKFTSMKRIKERMSRALDDDLWHLFVFMYSTELMIWHSLRAFRDADQSLIHRVTDSWDELDWYWSIERERERERKWWLRITRNSEKEYLVMNGIAECQLKHNLVALYLPWDGSWNFLSFSQSLIQVRSSHSSDSYFTFLLPLPSFLLLV